MQIKLMIIGKVLDEDSFWKLQTIRFSEKAKGWRCDPKLWFRLSLLFSGSEQNIAEKITIENKFSEDNIRKLTQGRVVRSPIKLTQG